MAIPFSLNFTMFVTHRESSFEEDKLWLESRRDKEEESTLALKVKIYKLKVRGDIRLRLKQNRFLR